MLTVVTLGSLYLSVAGVHHMIHHRGRGHRGDLGSLLGSLRREKNRLFGKCEASPSCGILKK